MRICDVPDCGKKHESRGYCKSHYKSLMRHGNPLQVDINKSAAKKRKPKEKVKKRELHSTEGTCFVQGCEKPIKARRLCDMHHARMRRTGSLETTRIGRGSIKVCLVIGCTRPHKSNGYCDTHTSIYQANGTPYRAKIIKMCGVKNCEEKHWGKGLCRSHFLEWKKVLRQNKLHQGDDD